MNLRSSIPLGLTLAAMLLAGAASAFALDDEEAVSSAGSALSSQKHPWYDEEADDLRTLRVAPSPAAPEPDYPDWEWGNSTSTAGPSVPSVWWIFFEWLFFALLIAVFVALIALLVYYFIRNQDELGPASQGVEAEAPGDAERIENLPFPVRRPQGDLLDEARRQYEAGNFNEAIVYLYSYQLIQLDRHQFLRLAQGKTNRQYLREVRREAELASLLERTMIAFEDVFFGHHSLTRERFESSWNKLNDFHQIVATAPVA